MPGIVPALLRSGFPKLAEMRGSDRSRHLASRAQTRSSNPTHRILQPDSLMHQILAHASQLAGHSGDSALGAKARARSQIRYKCLPVDLLQPWPGLASLEPTSPSVQLIAYALQALLAQSACFTHLQIIINQTDPSLHALV